MEKLIDLLFKGTDSTLNNIIKALLLGFVLALIIDFAVPDGKYYYIDLDGNIHNFYTKEAKDEALKHITDYKGSSDSPDCEFGNRDRNRNIAIITGIISTAVLFLIYNKPKK